MVFPLDGNEDWFVSKHPARPQPSKKRQAYSAQDFQKGMAPALDWVHRGNARVAGLEVAVGELARGGEVGRFHSKYPATK